MMDMVRKHCVPGTGNHDAAQACVDRTLEMMRMFRESTRNFVSQYVSWTTLTSFGLYRHDWHCKVADNTIIQVPPRDSIDSVPLGASSASMYPGYSPADHIYGEAAAEYGAMISEARRQGKEIESDPDGIEYVVGQTQLSAREQLEVVRKSFAAKQETQTGDTSTSTGQNQESGEPMEGVEQTTDASQLFVVDSNPTPVSILQGKSDVSSSKGKNRANDKAKRRVSFQEEQSNASADVPEASRKIKKLKVSKAEEDAIEPKPLVEEDDISAEVDKRLAEKEERRRRKMEKKRKRESGSSHVTESGTVDVPSENVQVKKPQEKKHKKQRKPEEVGEAEPAGSEEKKPKKGKKQKRAGTDGEIKGEDGTVVESEKPKKRRKQSDKATV